ncbi:MAG: TolC family protein [Candidatus Riflebacteria bacterium]|nr:TolC family protein [Candidatus Riflebacteria bacterium]
MNRLFLTILLLTSISLAPLPAQEIELKKPVCKEFGAFNIFASDSASLLLSVDDAINSTLSNNLALSVENYGPQLSETDVANEKARFDALINAEVSGSERIGKTIFQQGNLGDTVSNRTDAALSLNQLSTSGTRTTIDLSHARTRSATRADNLYATRLGFTLEHPLRRGAGRSVNLVSLRKAELDLDWSEFELQGFVLGLVAQVETRYWQYYLRLRQLEIVKESLELAKQQREETNRRIEAGSIAESEAAAAEAEVALRFEELINAESQSVTAAVSLLRTINHDQENFWKLRPELTDAPLLKHPDALELDTHLQTALQKRPELAQAKLLSEKDALDIVQSENGLLPRLDFFATIGKTGYSTALDQATPKFGEKGSYDISAGFVYEISRGRRAAKAELRRAKASREMRLEAIKNLEQIIKEDVIIAFIEVKRTIQQMTATAATSQKQLEKLRVEEVKFNVGKTTAFQVAQAQRDLTAAQIAEVKAAVDYTTAIIELFRADGSLLERNRIALEAM